MSTEAFGKLLRARIVKLPFVRHGRVLLEL